MVCQRLRQRKFASSINGNNKLKSSSHSEPRNSPTERKRGWMAGLKVSQLRISYISLQRNRKQRWMGNKNSLNKNNCCFLARDTYHNNLLKVLTKTFGITGHEVEIFIVLPSTKRLLIPALPSTLINIIITKWQADEEWEESKAVTNYLLYTIAIKYHLPEFARTRQEEHTFTFPDRLSRASLATTKRTYLHSSAVQRLLGLTMSCDGDTE